MNLREFVDQHPLSILCTIIIATATITGVVLEQIRINPLQAEIVAQSKVITENKKVLERTKVLSEYDSLVVYDSDKWFKSGDSFAILGGQVSIKINDIIDESTIFFGVDVAGESLQHIRSDDDERATFSYADATYIINIVDYIKGDNYDSDKNEIKLSISKLKKV
ncbi:MULTISPECIES: hypothetical protein [Bacillus]|uniref:hypothetical protein n=1 Tax=Bacillus TaxID=1386 RepID=UPI0003167B4B|nr:MULTISPECIES: hypothetical protein [Bacillus]